MALTILYIALGLMLLFGIGLALWTVRPRLIELLTMVWVLGIGGMLFVAPQEPLIEQSVVFGVLCLIVSGGAAWGLSFARRFKADHLAHRILLLLVGIAGAIAVPATLAVAIAGIFLLPWLLSNGEWTMVGTALACIVGGIAAWQSNFRLLGWAALIEASAFTAAALWWHSTLHYPAAFVFISCVVAVLVLRLERSASSSVDERRVRRGLERDMRRGWSSDRLYMVTEADIRSDP